MAQIIPSFVNRTVRGRRGSYPTHEWFDGTARRLIRGIDFHCKSTSLASYIRILAFDKNVKLCITNVTEGSIDIEARRR